MNQLDSNFLVSFVKCKKTIQKQFKRIKKRYLLLRFSR